MASDPTLGYVADAPYRNQFYRELAPAFLNYVVALSGMAPPVPIDRPFSYLDLGAGYARSTVINAAAYPGGEFHACDFFPPHIAEARRFASELGVQNLHLHETYIQDLPLAALPAFDFVVLHGVYSWVGEQVRASIRSLVQRKLKPGGVLYLSYNCHPGWSSELSLRALLFELSRSKSGDSAARAAGALSALSELAQPNLKYFREHPSAKAAFEALAGESGNYLAHEYLNRAFEVYHSNEIAEQMESIGAVYVGSATLPFNHPQLVVDGKIGSAIAKLEGRRARELALDCAVNQRFRRDVFVAGPLSARSRASALSDVDRLIVGCTDSTEALSTQAAIPRGMITFAREFIAELRRVLATGAIEVGALVRELSGAGRNEVEIRQNLFFLIAAGGLLPFARAEARARRRAPTGFASNAVERAVRQIASGESDSIVPSEEAGNGVSVSAHEARAALRFVAHASDPPSRLVRLGLLA